MKKCPVCKAAVFDDMRTCFGCMYQFGSNVELEGRSSLDGVDANGARFSGAGSKGDAATEGGACQDAGAGLKGVSQGGDVGTEAAVCQGDATGAQAVACQGDAMGAQAVVCQGGEARSKGKVDLGAARGFAEWAIKLEVRSELNPEQVLSLELSPPLAEKRGGGAPLGASPPESHAKLNLPLVEVGCAMG